MVSTRRRRMRGGSDNLAPKPKAMCQCYSEDGKGCRNESVGNSEFCLNHKNKCPKPPLTGYEPTYKDLKKYDDPLELRLSHNCYDASMMRMDNNSVKKCKDNKNKTSSCREYFGQPGARFGGRYELNAEERRTCPIVKKLVIEDNPDITETTFYDKCPAETSKIAYMVHDGVDFHFEVQLEDGNWGGKPGSNKTYTVDAVGKPIFNPDISSHDYRWQGSDLNYKPCGFLCVPRNRKVELGSVSDESKAQKGGQNPPVPLLGLGWNDPYHLRKLSYRAGRLADQRKRWTRRQQRQMK